MPYILVLGTSIVDITGFSTVHYRPNNSNPGCVKVSLGGVCRNIAETTARLDIPTKFISIIGDDDHGKNIVDHATRVGCDMSDSLFLEGATTPTYMAILNEKGEMVSAVVDMWSACQMDIDFIDTKASVFEEAAYTVLDADHPELLGYILKTYRGKTRFILDPISAVKAESVRHLLPLFHTIKPNRYEAEALLGFSLDTPDDLLRAADAFLSLGIVNVFISLDADGIFYANAQERGILKAEDVDVVNVTGAGDAFVAGLAYGYMHELPLLQTVQFAISVSLLTISHADTIHPDLSYKHVKILEERTRWHHRAL